MFELFDVVRLKEKRPELGLTTENLGAIVDIELNGNAITVDFFEDEDNDYMDALYNDFKPEELTLVSRSKK